MIVTCGSCGRSYDDAKCWTYCPHERFITDELAAQKDLAFSLVDERLRFAHEPVEGHPGYRVQSINHAGMVTLTAASGLVGEFAPHLFVVIE